VDGADCPWDSTAPFAGGGLVRAASGVTPRTEAIRLALTERLARDQRLDVGLFDGPLLTQARDGARRFGKGRHAAALNFGDLYAYALAMDRGLPLLFVGVDSQRTDVSALPY
jgi:ribonuclease VapC